MAHDGTAFFFSEHLRLDRDIAIRQSARLFSATSVHMIDAWIGGDRRWEEFCRYLGRPEDARWQGEIADLQPPDESETMDPITDYRNLAWDTSLDQAIDMSKEHSTVKILFKNVIWKQMEKEIALIPPSVKDSFLPTSPSILLGPFDIYDGFQYDLGKYIARSEFALCFFGHGLPNDYDDFKRRFVELPTVKELRAKFEAVFGPLEYEIVWDS